MGGERWSEVTTLRHLLMLLHRWLFRSLMIQKDFNDASFSSYIPLTNSISSSQSLTHPNSLFMSFSYSLALLLSSLVLSHTFLVHLHSLLYIHLLNHSSYNQWQTSFLSSATNSFSLSHWLIHLLILSPSHSLAQSLPLSRLISH